jgi:hypothetical protein
MKREVSSPRRRKFSTTNQELRRIEARGLVIRHFQQFIESGGHGEDLIMELRGRSLPRSLERKELPPVDAPVEVEVDVLVDPVDPVDNERQRIIAEIRRNRAEDPALVDKCIRMYT